MPVAQKLPCVLTRIIAHGERVYTLELTPERRAPKFRAGQFLHLALDPYDPTSFWPESRVFSIASGADGRERLRITYAVHGAFTERMAQLVEGQTVWVKLPYGDFVIDQAQDVVLFAGGTGVTAFTAFLDDLPPAMPHAVLLAYGARTPGLLIYRETVERVVARVPAVRALLFVESGQEPEPPQERIEWRSGWVSVDAVWPMVSRPAGTIFYISGPPAMLRGIGDELRARQIAPEAIRIDAWE